LFLKPQIKLKTVKKFLSTPQSTQKHLFTTKTIFFTIIRTLFQVNPHALATHVAPIGPFTEHLHMLIVLDDKLPPLDELDTSQLVSLIVTCTPNDVLSPLLPPQQPP
jgi:hypothetical protein